MNLQLVYRYIVSLSKNENMFKKQNKTTKKREKEGLLWWESNRTFDL